MECLLEYVTVRSNGIHAACPRSQARYTGQAWGQGGTARDIARGEVRARSWGKLAQAGHKLGASWAQAGRKLAQAGRFGCLRTLMNRFSRTVL